MWNRSVTLTRADVETTRHRAKCSGRAHNVARESFVHGLTDVLALCLACEAGDADSEDGVDPGTKRSWLTEIHDSVDCQCTASMMRVSMSAQILLRRLYARPEVLAAANRGTGSPLRSDEFAALVHPRSAPWTVSDVPILNKCEELLGSMPSSSTTSREADEGAIKHARETTEAQNLGGDIVTAQMLTEQVTGRDTWTLLSGTAVKDRMWTYGHIVVDETQELSPMAWRALLRRCPSHSFTMVGDLDQRRGSRRPPTWGRALGPAAHALVAEYALTVSYRMPATLTILAEGVVARAGASVLYPMTAVHDVEDCYRVTHVNTLKDAPVSLSKENSPLWRAVAQIRGKSEEQLDREVGTSRGRIALTVNKERARVWEVDADDEMVPSERVRLLSAMASRGLEFDSVILVKSVEILDDGVGDLFVALTHATHDVYVVHYVPLPAGMEEW